MGVRITVIYCRKFCSRQPEVFGGCGDISAPSLRCSIGNRHGIHSKPRTYRPRRPNALFQVAHFVSSVIPHDLKQCARSAPLTNTSSSRSNTDKEPQVLPLLRLTMHHRLNFPARLPALCQQHHHHHHHQQLLLLPAVTLALLLLT